MMKPPPPKYFCPILSANLVKPLSLIETGKPPEGQRAAFCLEEQCAWHVAFNTGDQVHRGCAASFLPVALFGVQAAILQDKGVSPDGENPVVPS